MRPSKASVTQTWLLFTQLCILKDHVIRCVREFIRRAKSMLFSQNMVADSAEISVISVGKDPNHFQIAEIRIHDSVCIEIPTSEDSPLLGSVRVWFFLCLISDFSTFGSFRILSQFQTFLRGKTPMMNSIVLGLIWIGFSL